MALLTPEPPGNLLLVLAHPTYEDSRANRALFDAVGTPEGVTLHDLYETYPDFAIDVRREQSRLAAHRAVLLQYPLQWYAMPALLKHWFDDVWTYGFAHGADATALAGKPLSAVITTGSETAAYGREGRHFYTMTEFLCPLERTAHLCRMRWTPPLVIHSDGLEGATGPYLARLQAFLDEAAP